MAEVRNINSTVKYLQQKYLRGSAGGEQEYCVDRRDLDTIKSLQHLVMEGNATLGTKWDDFAFVCSGIDRGRQKLKNVCEGLEQGCIPDEVITVERAYTTQIHIGGGWESDSHIYQMDREIIWDLGVLTEKIKFDLLTEKITFPTDTSVEKGRYSSWDLNRLNNIWIQKNGALHFWGNKFLNFGNYVDYCNARGDLKSLPPEEHGVNIFIGKSVIKLSRYGFTKEDYSRALEMLDCNK